MKSEAKESLSIARVVLWYLAIDNLIKPGSLFVIPTHPQQKHHRITLEIQTWPRLLLHLVTIIIQITDYIASRTFSLAFWSRAPFPVDNIAIRLHQIGDFYHNGHRKASVFLGWAAFRSTKKGFWRAVRGRETFLRDHLKCCQRQWEANVCLEMISFNLMGLPPRYFQIFVDPWRGEKGFSIWSERDDSRFAFFGRETLICLRVEKSFSRL